MQMYMPRVLILCFVAQILLLVTADEEEAKREAIDFANKAVRLSLMALPSVRDARSYPTSSVGTMGGSLGHRWIMNVYMGNYSGSIANLDSNDPDVKKPTSIIEEIPKAMAMASPAAADVAGSSHSSSNTKHSNNPSASVLFKEPIKNSTPDDLAADVKVKVNQIAANIDSVIKSDKFFLHKLSKDHKNVDADSLHDLKMLFLYGCFYSNLQGQLETVGLKANMNLDLKEADQKLANSETEPVTDEIKDLRNNFMPYWLGTMQQKLVALITSKMAQIKRHNNNGKQKTFLEKANDVAKGLPFVGHLFTEEHAILNELNQCKKMDMKKTGHKEQMRHHKTDDDKSGKRGV